MRQLPVNIRTRRISRPINILQRLPKSIHHNVHRNTLFRHNQYTITRQYNRQHNRLKRITTRYMITNQIGDHNRSQEIPVIRRTKAMLQIHGMTRLSMRLTRLLMLTMMLQQRRLTNYITHKQAKIKTRMLSRPILRHYQATNMQPQ